MKIITHGAAREVGRSCIEINCSEGRFLLDLGLKFGSEGYEFPEVKTPETVDCLFLSHAHLDHSGSIPLYKHAGLNCDIVATSATKMITQMLLEDSYKIESRGEVPVPYDQNDIYDALRNFYLIKFDKGYTRKRLSFRCFNAGHIPGSTLFEFKMEGKRVVYTGDLNTVKTRLMNPCTYLEPVDVLIIESTYGNRDHLPRQEVETKFLNAVEKGLARRGNVIIPVFTVGRSQEIIMALNEKQWSVPIYFDGLAKQLTKKLKWSDFDGNMKGMAKAYNLVKLIDGNEHRHKLFNSGKQAIYVTTSGMIQGGPILDYIKMSYKNKKDSILLTGYQVEGTNGRTLIEEGFAIVDNKRYDPVCYIEKFDFSAHSGLNELLDFIARTKPKHLVLVHGDDEAIENLAKLAKEKLKIKNIYTPKREQIIEIK